MNKILIVEDEELIRKGLVYLVPWKEMDCCIAADAANGEDGLRMIEKTLPDIVISDIRMPGMDGLEMLERAMEQYDFEAILLSGYSDFEYAKKGISLGVRDYITKPLDFDELCACICRLTHERTARKQRQLKLIQAENLLKQKTLLNPPKNKEPISNDPYTEKLLHILELEYHRKLTLNGISHELGISPSYLNSKFKAATGYTFNTYLNRYRIAKAIKLLSEDGCSAYETAERTGFYDYKYFLKVFKKYTGYTPSQFLHGQQRLFPPPANPL